MARVYRVGSLYGVEYFNTAKEADRCKPGGEEPEEVIAVDAAAECNRLERYCEESERVMRAARRLLEEVRDSSPVELFSTDLGRRVNKFITDHPLPPATSADRDGQRSYGV